MDVVGGCNIVSPRDEEQVLVSFDWITDTKPAHVRVSGDFNDWKEAPLYPVSDANDHPCIRFRRFLKLSPGVHHLKFQNEAEWYCSEVLPTVQHGDFLNNYIVVAPPTIPKVIVVLGERLDEHGEAGPILKSRVDCALELLTYIQNVDTIIFSGGCVSAKLHPSEAKVMKDIAEPVLEQYPHIRVLIEENSLNTFENAYYSKAIISGLRNKESEMKSVSESCTKKRTQIDLQGEINLVLVTSDFHFRRALKIFETVFRDQNVLLTGEPAHTRMIMEVSHYDERVKLEQWFLGEVDQKLEFYAKEFSQN